MGKLFSLVCPKTVQNAPISVAPAIDGLLHIAHNQAVRPLREAFEQQQAEAVLLHALCNPETRQSLHTVC